MQRLFIFSKKNFFRLFAFLHFFYLQNVSVEWKRKQIKAKQIKKLQMKWREREREREGERDMCNSECEDDK
jgi:hypothetical protein